MKVFDRLEKVKFNVVKCGDDDEADDIGDDKPQNPPIKPPQG